MLALPYGTRADGGHGSNANTCDGPATGALDGLTAVHFPTDNCALALKGAPTLATAVMLLAKYDTYFGADVSSWLAIYLVIFHGILHLRSARRIQ